MIGAFQRRGIPQRDDPALINLGNGETRMGSANVDCYDLFHVRSRSVAIINKNPLRIRPFPGMECNRTGTIQAPRAYPLPHPSQKKDRSGPNIISHIAQKRLRKV
ncbi:hypothetical protein AA0614_0250 [Komagataeibacter saccharivorans NRIC 0614]|nr:hypothetical protein AA0614_0250 [Komagataeibacter saccharivorans NRIC 0614]